MMKSKLTYALLSFIFIVWASVAQIPDLSSLMPIKADVSAVPDTYPFSWKYTMEIQTDNAKSMTVNYLLEKDASYFGMMISQGDNDMLIVMDAKKELTVTAFGKGNQKMAMASKMAHLSEVAEKETKRKFTYKSLPPKTILGYKCIGVEAVDAEYKMVFYFTKEAPVNFAELFKSPQTQQLPEMFKNYFKPGDNPLMLSVDITDKTKGKTTMMRCVALEKNEFAFRKADYKFM